MRKDREDTIFLRLTESWVGVVACCSCGRASIHHESLKNEEKEAWGGGRNGSKWERERKRENRCCLRQEDDNEEGESSRRKQESSKFIVYRLDRLTKKRRRNVEEKIVKKKEKKFRSFWTNLLSSFFQFVINISKHYHHRCNHLSPPRSSSRINISNLIKNSWSASIIEESCVLHPSFNIFVIPKKKSHIYFSYKCIYPKALQNNRSCRSFHEKEKKNLQIDQRI